MKDWTNFLGVLASALGLFCYLPYIWDVLKGATKPHAFSWFVWGFAALIAFLGQVADGGGSGSWATGVSACLSLLIFILALSRGDTSRSRGDYISLILALIAIPLWILTSTPLWSVILVSLIDFFGFLPTYRKAFQRPAEETGSTFLISGFKYLLSIFAMENLSLVTVLYPLVVLVNNWVFVGMLLYRRRALRK